MRAVNKRVLSSVCALSLGAAILLIGATPANADASGSKYCSGSAFPTLFTYSTAQVQHIHQNANRAGDRSSRYSPPGPTNFTTRAAWNSDLWYVSGTDVASYRSVYCS